MLRQRKVVQLQAEEFIKMAHQQQSRPVQPLVMNLRDGVEHALVLDHLAHSLLPVTSILLLTSNWSRLLCSQSLYTVNQQREGQQVEEGLTRKILSFKSVPRPLVNGTLPDGGVTITVQLIQLKFR